MLARKGPKRSPRKERRQGLPRGPVPPDIKEFARVIAMAAAKEADKKKKHHP